MRFFDSLKQTFDPPERGGELHDAAGTGVVAWAERVDLRWIGWRCAKICEGRLTGSMGRVKRLQDAQRRNVRISMSLELFRGSAAGVGGATL
jgi:hypothetical protein